MRLPLWLKQAGTARATSLAKAGIQLFFSWGRSDCLHFPSFGKSEKTVLAESVDGLLSLELTHHQTPTFPIHALLGIAPPQPKLIFWFRAICTEHDFQQCPRAFTKPFHSPQTSDVADATQDACRPHHSPWKTGHSFLMVFFHAKGTCKPVVRVTWPS